MNIRRNNPLLVTPTPALPTRIGVVGAGTIGPDIAYYLLSALPELTLHLVDIDQGPLDEACARIEGYTKKGVAKRKLSEEQAARVMENLSPTLDYGALAGCDWVLEAATEDLPLKRKIFAQLEEVLDDEALITSNTSSLPASRIFETLERPERATVTHFFAPAYRNLAVEVIRAPKTAPEVVDYLRWLLCMTGKVPLETTDVVCFMLDRVFDNWCNEAAYLLDQATASEVDSVAAEWVHAGPFYVLNFAHGNPIIVETNTHQMVEGEHYRPAPIFRSVDRWQTLRPGERVPVDPATATLVRTRLLGSLFTQSFEIVDRAIGTAADLELGCKLALGFRRGPFEIVEELGDDAVSKIVRDFVADRPGMPQPRRTPSSYTDLRRHVLVDDLDGVRVLTLRRPQAMNALDDDVTDELLAVIREHERDATGFVLVGYGPRAFCAGADIGRFPDMLGDETATADYARHCSRLLRHLDAMDKPVVAAVNGMALGGGLELALRCHGIVAVANARLSFPEIELGIAPGLGGLVVPYRRWPQAAGLFHRMLRLGERVSAAQAHELGVVDAIAKEPGELIGLACARVRELAGAIVRASDAPVSVGALPPVDPASLDRPLSAEVVAIIERAIEEGAAATTFAEALEVGYRAFGTSACTAAAKEGIGAFLEHRRPDFSGTG